MIEDHNDMYHVPMTFMVYEICDKIHKSDFSTLILCGTVHVQSTASHVLLKTDHSLRTSPYIYSFSYILVIVKH